VRDRDSAGKWGAIDEQGYDRAFCTQRVRLHPAVDGRSADAQSRADAGYDLADRARRLGWATIEVID
jgi:hypothetical protein